MKRMVYVLGWFVCLCHSVPAFSEAQGSKFILLVQHHRSHRFRHCRSCWKMNLRRRQGFGCGMSGQGQEPLWILPRKEMWIWFWSMRSPLKRNLWQKGLEQRESI